MLKRTALLQKVPVVTAENGRVTVENARVTAEDVRKSAETSRQDSRECTRQC